MKLKVAREELPGPVVRRFPYLETALHEMAINDESFRQLCHDYQDLVSALEQTSNQSGDTRADLLGLKITLEVEILEQVTRKDVLGQR